jgi:hypothetical protein
MGTVSEPKPVKLFVALLAADTDLLSRVDNSLRVLFGPIDCASPTLPWSVSDYYESEMGRGLSRRFLSFERLISPGALAEIKRHAGDIEDDYRRAEGPGRRRSVNIDPGYVDADKVVLASTKGAGHRIYLGSGIYSEITLLYHGGAFHSFVYTYADYLWPESMAFLTDIRAQYLEQVKR